MRLARALPSTKTPAPSCDTNFLTGPYWQNRKLLELPQNLKRTSPLNDSNATLHCNEMSHGADGAKQFCQSYGGVQKFSAEAGPDHDSTKAVKNHSSPRAFGVYVRWPESPARSALGLRQSFAALGRKLALRKGAGFSGEHAKSLCAPASLRESIFLIFIQWSAI